MNLKVTFLCYRYRLCAVDLDADIADLSPRQDGKDLFNIFAVGLKRKCNPVVDPPQRETVVRGDMRSPFCRVFPPEITDLSIGPVHTLGGEGMAAHQRFFQHPGIYPWFIGTNIFAAGCADL